MELMPIIRPTLPEFREFEELVRPSWDEGQVTTGRIVRAFEEEVCRQTGAREAVAMSSCTAGLMLAAQAMELPAGAEVIVPSFTFAATAQALVWNGLVPVFCDCLPETLTLDPADVERNLTSRTAAICAAYVYGLPPDIEALAEIGERHGLPVYFDSAQGLGAEYQGRKAGGFGACEIFSLSPTKVVTAIEGGRDLHQRPRLSARLRSMRDYGKDPQKGEDMVHLGLSARMSELHAAVGLLSLQARGRAGEGAAAAHRGLPGAARRAPGMPRAEHSARPDEQRELLRAVHHRTGPGRAGTRCTRASRRAGSRPSATSIRRSTSRPFCDGCRIG